MRAGSLHKQPCASRCHPRIVAAVTGVSIRSAPRTHPTGAERSSTICRARKARQAADTQQQAEPEGSLLLVQVVPTDEQEDQPGVYLPYDPDQYEIQPRFVNSEEILDGLDGVDVRQQPEAAAVEDVQVRLHCLHWTCVAAVKALLQLTI